MAAGSGLRTQASGYGVEDIGFRGGLGFRVAGLWSSAKRFLQLPRGPGVGGGGGSDAALRSSGLDSSFKASPECIWRNSAIAS